MQCACLTKVLRVCIVKKDIYTNHSRFYSKGISVSESMRENLLHSWIWIRQIRILQHLLNHRICNGQVRVVAYSANYSLVCNWLGGDLNEKHFESNELLRYVIAFHIKEGWILHLKTGFSRKRRKKRKGEMLWFYEYFIISGEEKVLFC